MKIVRVYNSRIIIVVYFNLLDPRFPWFESYFDIELAYTVFFVSSLSWRVSALLHTIFFTRCFLSAPGSRSNPCDPNPCQNGGQCVDQDNSYQCLCQEGFSGTNCELGLRNNPCDANPCQNGGQCTAVDGKPVCTCPEEFEGEFCEKPKGKFLLLIFRNIAKEDIVSL